MPSRVFENAYGRPRTPAGRTAPGTLHAELREAFRDWLDASKECSAFETDVLEHGVSPTAERRLAELKRRVEAKAKAFDRAKRRCSSSSLYMATLYAAISGGK